MHDCRRSTGLGMGVLHYHACESFHVLKLVIQVVSELLYPRYEAQSAATHLRRDPYVHTINLSIFSLIIECVVLGHHRRLP